MSIIQKIKEAFSGKKEKIKAPRIKAPKHIPLTEKQIEQGERETIVGQVLDKFDAEFHNPRLQCFYCQQIIDSGKIRFFQAPGQTQSSPYHKRCFKKLKRGVLPGQ
jgi:hypothetical protein